MHFIYFYIPMKGYGEVLSTVLAGSKHSVDGSYCFICTWPTPVTHRYPQTGLSHPAPASCALAPVFCQMAVEHLHSGVKSLVAKTLVQN